MLCQRNKFFCDACCGLQEAEKRMKIKHSPNILALHLKRFKYQEDLQKYVKLSYRVAFPFELRLFNTVDDAVNPDRLYELFAIVVHIGRYAVQSSPLTHERADSHTNSPPSPYLSRDSGPHHGHYITIIKAQGSWVVFDDDSVETIKESEIPKYYGEGSSGAYVLFYQAVDMDREALGLPPDLPTPSAVDVVNEGAAVGGAAAIVVDPASPLPMRRVFYRCRRTGRRSQFPSSPLLPNAKGPADAAQA
jgi:ubiquitin carboxyl-terminal hydrolase 9/13